MCKANLLLRGKHTDGIWDTYMECKGSAKFDRICALGARCKRQEEWMVNDTQTTGTGDRIQSDECIVTRLSFKRG